MIVWLWDASGTPGTACGVSGDYDSAQRAADACLAAGDAAAATLQAARLTDRPDALDPRYVRFGPRWQATRTRSGAVHWTELAAHPQPDPPSRELRRHHPKAAREPPDPPLGPARRRRHPAAPGPSPPLAQEAIATGADRMRWLKADSAAVEPPPMAVTICL
jgi:hypothetical protein